MQEYGRLGKGRHATGWAWEERKGEGCEGTSRQRMDGVVCEGTEGEGKRNEERDRMKEVCGERKGSARKEREGKTRV